MDSRRRDGRSVLTPSGWSVRLLLLRSVSIPKKRTSRNLDAGPLQDDIDLFELHLLSENKSPKTILTYLSAARWFAAEGLDVADWSDVKAKHVKLWIARLVREYSDSYANNQFRSLQQYFRWYAEEEEVSACLRRKTLTALGAWLRRWVAVGDQGYAPSLVACLWGATTLEQGQMSAVDACGQPSLDS
jgi:Phage integrase, N-terminal SAM-like domain